MATILYFHNATDTTANLPSTEQSSATADDDFEGSKTTNRKMDLFTGTAQVAMTNTSIANTARNAYYVTRWVSPRLNETHITVSSYQLNIAAAESSKSAKFPWGCVTSYYMACSLYVWRISSGTKIGTIYDSSPTSFQEPLTIDTEQVMEKAFTGTTVAGLIAGDDVLVCELWASMEQAMSASYTQTVYFDGTTVNTIGT